MSLADVMLDCQTMIEPQAQKRDIRITFPRFESPCFVYADRTRVKQVLLNLLSNAIKYNRVGGTVVVDCTVISQERVRVSVTDTGAGLTPDKLEQLFQSFNRLGQENSAEEGTGIGLVVSKRLIELMGGAIGVESTVGSGSVFWIELNMTAEPQHTVDAAALAAHVPPPGDNGMRLRTLLYVEDNPANLMLVEQLIARRADMRLLSASNAKLGISLARAHQPEIILMDINLPGIKRRRSTETSARGSVDKTHSRHSSQRQRNATRHQERSGVRFFQVSHQAHQGQRIHGHIGRGIEIFGSGISGESSGISHNFSSRNR